MRTGAAQTMMGDLKNITLHFSAKQRHQSRISCILVCIAHNQRCGLSDGILDHLTGIVGIVDQDGFRQFREVVLIVGRKNGKTLFASAIANYMMFADGEYGARIYFCAPKLEQAELCYDGFYQMILQEPELDELADIFLGVALNCTSVLALEYTKDLTKDTAPSALPPLTINMDLALAGKALQI